MAHDAEYQICHHCQVERAWWRVWAAVALTIATLSFAAMKAYNAGFAAGVSAVRATDRGDDEHKASGCVQDGCPWFLPQEPEPPSNKIAL